MPALSTASAHRRPLATAAVAAGALCAVWFMPSANASPDGGAGTSPGSTGTQAHAERSAETRASQDDGDGGSTPYVLGGIGVGAVGIGSLLAAEAVRRNRHGTA